MLQPTRQPSASNPFEFSGFLPVLRRWWWLLVLSAVIAGVAAHFSSSQADPEYESRAQLLVGPINTSLDVLRAAGSLAQTYAELATSRPLLEQTIEELRLPMSASELDAHAAATASDVTRVLTIRIRNTDPQVAASIANTLADNLAALAAEDEAGPEGALAIVDAAGPGARVGANNSLVVAVASAAALLGVLTLLLVIEFVRATVRSEAELGQISGLPLLGSLNMARWRSAPGRPLPVEAEAGSRVASQVRLLAAEIEFNDRETPPRSMLLISVQDEPGAGRLAANVAAIHARGGHRVVLVDADETSAEATRLLGLDGMYGVTDLLAGAEAPEGGALPLVRWAYSPQLSILPRGRETTGTAIDAERVEALLGLLLADFDRVIVVGSSAQSSPAGLIWARLVEATILTAARDRTKRVQIADAAEGLRLVGAKLAGTVLIERVRELRRPGSRRARQADRPRRQPDLAGDEQAIAAEAASPNGAGSPRDGDTVAEPVAADGDRVTGR